MKITKKMLELKKNEIEQHKHKLINLTFGEVDMHKTIVERIESDSKTLGVYEYFYNKK